MKCSTPFPSFHQRCLYPFNHSIVANSELNNDHLASRLAKTSQLIYRFAGFFCLLECAMEIAEKYLAEYGSFGNGRCDLQLFKRIQSIVENTYGFISDNGSIEHFVVHESIARRATDIALANLEQYKLLLFVHKDDGRHWNVLPGSQARFYSHVPLNSVQMSAAQGDARSDMCEKPNRRIFNLLKKSNPLKVNILLHDSIIFVKSGLYVDWKLKGASSIIDKTLLPELVSEGLLMEIKNGIVGKFNKPTVFIKVVPGGNTSLEDLDRMLALYGDDRLTVQVYLDKCKKVKVEGCGKVSNDVFEIFNRSEYMSLRLDLSPLTNLKPSSWLYVLVVYQSILFFRHQSTDEPAGRYFACHRKYSVIRVCLFLFTTRAVSNSDENDDSVDDRDLPTVKSNHPEESVMDIGNGKMLIL